MLAQFTKIKLFIKKDHENVLILESNYQFYALDYALALSIKN